MLSLFVFAMCCGLLTASPSSERRRRDLTSLPATVPLELLFSACGDQTASTDIGPCVQDLLGGAIELAKPSFATGVDLGKGNVKILEPLSLNDVPAKPGSKFSFSLKNLKVSGLSTVKVEDVRLEPDNLELKLSFEQLTASASVRLRYTFITGNSKVSLKLVQPRISVGARWSLAEEDGGLSLKLTHPKVTIEIASLRTTVTDLGGLGRFVQTLLNTNNALILDLLIPNLEKQAEQKLATEFSSIKLTR